MSILLFLLVAPTLEWLYDSAESIILRRVGAARMARYRMRIVRPHRFN